MGSSLNQQLFRMLACSRSSSSSTAGRSKSHGRDMFLRFPVRSYSRFRCVSEPWLPLVTGSGFMESSVKASNGLEMADDYTNHNLLLASTDPFVINMYSCSLHSVLHNFPVNMFDVEPPKRAGYPSLYLMGSCKGILCVLEGCEDIILWNPTIGHLKKLPNSGINHHSYKISTRGFGYDELNDDFKVVEICCYARLGINRETIVNVYSLKSNSWRRIKDYEGGIISCSPGVFLNGVLHWPATHKDGLNTDWSILSLDVSAETHGTTLMLPQCENGFDDLRLGVLKGRLCVFCNYYRHEMHVWMMKEYGSNKSWCKFASIPYSQNIPGRILPLCVSKSGEILVKYGDSLMLFNKADDSFTETEVKMDDPASLYEVATYTETFVSPYLYDDVKDQI
ncbi:OLC1v1019313C1 [Oldenlandia corymbosa var. corymbosa]|uniref:OLC1v1019313C1 n=1 Tax=Oldenlandia corymbosa var. corymbosa TaxID=529605 RepID=A0AAV1EDQ7_OLDCO|nr:OLC1v1019313C1 [Oldenlandia corymbosa var. corymbosa]